MSKSKAVNEATGKRNSSKLNPSSTICNQRSKQSVVLKHTRKWALIGGQLVKVPLARGMPLIPILSGLSPHQAIVLCRCGTVIFLN